MEKLPRDECLRVGGCLLGSWRCYLPLLIGTFGDEYSNMRLLRAYLAVACACDRYPLPNRRQNRQSTSVGALILIE